jgi:hypothetical protein
MVIFSLAAVNFFLAGVGSVQLGRIFLFVSLPFGVSLPVANLSSSHHQQLKKNSPILSELSKK